MDPRTRKAIKFPPPWPLNKFPESFANCIGKEIIARLAADHTGAIEGETWEEMFAVSLGAKWKPSSIGLDDVVLKDCAWGAKTVKNGKPFTAETVRLISGRNDPTYSFGRRPEDPVELGEMVLSIWNKRVSDIKKDYRHVRSIVLIKPDAIKKEWLDFAVFEFNTAQFDPKQYVWAFNKNKNLEGYQCETKEHCFTWQWHGAQFTVIHKVPPGRLKLQVKKPPRVETDVVLKAVKYDDSWVRIIPPK